MVPRPCRQAAGVDVRGRLMVVFLFPFFSLLAVPGGSWRGRKFFTLVSCLFHACLHHGCLLAYLTWLPARYKSNSTTCDGLRGRDGLPCGLLILTSLCLVAANTILPTHVLLSSADTHSCTRTSSKRKGPARLPRYLLDANQTQAPTSHDCLRRCGLLPSSAAPRLPS